MDTRTLERKKYTGKDEEFSFGNGLYLRLRKVSKTWVFRTRLNGKTRITTLGKFPAISILAAQKLALEQKESLTSNVNVAVYVDIYYRDSICGSHNRRKKPNKRPEKSLQYLNEIKEAFGSQRLEDVTKAQLVAHIKKQVARGNATAEIVRQTLRGVFASAFEDGLVQSDPMLGVTTRVSGYKPADIDRTLSDDDIRKLWELPRCMNVVKFMLLTGMRVSEAVGGYIDGDYYRVDDSKNGRSHWVYLTETARALLPLERYTTASVQDYIRRHKLPYKSHDARRSYTTRLTEAECNPAVIEKSLNHTLSGVMKTYARNEFINKRIELAIIMEKIVLEIISQ